MIDHGMGVVIGRPEIGTGCLIYQGVTFWRNWKRIRKKTSHTKRQCSDWFWQAKILGNIVLESNVRVGAGSVVM